MRESRKYQKNQLSNFDLIKVKGGKRVGLTKFPELKLKKG